MLLSIYLTNLGRTKTVPLPHVRDYSGRVTAALNLAGRVPKRPVQVFIYFILYLFGISFRAMGARLMPFI